MKKPPLPEEIEITVFGPGYGECIVVHAGSGRWIVVDSCKHGAKTPPVALRYFELIGVDPAKQVELVLVTHWHDDHIRGLNELLERCESAGICISEALTRSEFIDFLSAYSTNRASALGTGVDEFVAVLEKMRDPKRNPLRGGQDKRILNITGRELAHGENCEVWTLSPSAFQVLESNSRFASLLPKAKTTMRRAVPEGKNNHSVAAWVSIGKTNVILGADLENTADARAGWASIVCSTNRPSGDVSLFKVPHHGSENGHNIDLWDNVLSVDVIAVVTPWNRSAGLPGPEDLERLGSATANLFLTAVPSSLARARHDHSVERMMREFGISTKRHVKNVGAVTARRHASAEGEWAVKRWEME
ncbi:beta-lactamase superfamily II metal-dependent hydrolase [Primorskyibacter sedentarius]|uniref:Beta-lactamase superfamily II metal-dependent hydrolase n=1 Tax=Primorskyibacter sedentarius TaxID=745311 RepID=A0A4R3IPU6_9RHOB|nr:MBL fold metallo-hydrolase [Primorskyibacter sedentarius]TCS49750.1 beta-lactamase superfamily II metal-dependent hydrolase [Primorskyibacter sedentarius]